MSGKFTNLLKMSKYEAIRKMASNDNYESLRCYVYYLQTNFLIVRDIFTACIIEEEFYPHANVIIEPIREIIKDIPYNDIYSRMDATFSLFLHLEEILRIKVDKSYMFTRFYTPCDMKTGELDWSGLQYTQKPHGGSAFMLQHFIDKNLNAS